jgi:O-antigen/teichoic acid export membrane protein
MESVELENINNKNKENAHQGAKRVAKNTGFLYARMAITVFISLYVTRLILSSLGAEDFGIYNLVGGMVAMLMFLNAAMAAASQRFMSYAQGEGDISKQKNIFNVSTLLHFFIAIALVLFLEFVGYFLFEYVLTIPIERLVAAKYVFHFMVLSTFFTVISVPYDAVINAHENMLLVAVVGVFESFLKLAIAIYITDTNFDKLIVFGMLMALSTILLLIIKLIYCHKNYIEVEVNVKKYFDRKLFKEMRNFASWSFLGSATSMLSFYGQGIVLNIFFGPIVNAAQAIAAQINGQMSAFSTTMLKALNPMIVKSEGSGDRALMLKASMLGAKLSFFLLMFFCIPVMIEMPYIFSFWLTDVPDYSIIFCQLLLVTNLITQLFLPLRTAIAAVGNIKKMEIYTSFLNIFPLPICYAIFTLGFTPYTLYIVYIIQQIILAIIVLKFCKINCGLLVSNFLGDVIARCITTFIIILGITLCVSQYINNPKLSLVTVIATNCVCFIFSTWYIGFNKLERSNNKNMVKKIVLKFKKIN